MNESESRIPADEISDAEKANSWRFKQLKDAGYPESIAMAIAMTKIDLHKAVNTLLAARKRAKEDPAWNFSLEDLIKSFWPVDEDVPQGVLDECAERDASEREIAELEAIPVGNVVERGGEKKNA